MLNWGKRLYLPQKREIYGFFTVFRGKIYKKYSRGNDEWIEFETSDYVVHK